MADLHGVPTGVWLGASHVLGRAVPAGEPYPHIDGITITSRIGDRIRLRRIDCAACTLAPVDRET